MAVAGIGQGGGPGSEGALYLVGGQGVHGREAGEQQCGDGDEASAPGDAVDDARRHEGREDQEQGQW
jgi:hypothetical protein